MPDTHGRRIGRGGRKIGGESYSFATPGNKKGTGGSSIGIQSSSFVTHGSFIDTHGNSFVKQSCSTDKPGSKKTNPETKRQSRKQKDKPGKILKSKPSYKKSNSQ